LYVIGVVAEVFVKEFSRCVYYVCLRFVKSSEFLRERAALLTDKPSLLYKRVSLCVARKVNRVQVQDLTTY
jgi:hypothetical protein